MDWGKLIGPLALALVNGCALQAGADLRTDGDPIGDEAGLDTGAVTLEDSAPDVALEAAPDAAPDAAVDTTVVTDSLVSPDVTADTAGETEPDSATADSFVGLDSSASDVVLESAPADTDVAPDTVVADSVVADSVVVDSSGADTASSDAATDGPIEVEVDAGPSLCAVDGDCPVGGHCRPVEGRLVCVNL